MIFGFAAMAMPHRLRVLNLDIEVSSVHTSNTSNWESSDPELKVDNAAGALGGADNESDSADGTGLVVVNLARRQLPRLYGGRRPCAQPPWIQLTIRCSSSCCSFPTTCSRTSRRKPTATRARSSMDPDHLRRAQGILRHLDGQPQPADVCLLLERG